MPIKTIVPAVIEDHDAIELACVILGLDPAKTDEFDIQEQLEEKWGMNLQGFMELSGLLLSMAGNFHSQLTKTHYRAFAVVQSDGTAVAVVKVSVDPKNQQNWK